MPAVPSGVNAAHRASIPAARAAPRSPARRATSTISSLPGMLHGVTVRSPVAARAASRGIDFEPDVPWDEFTIVTAADIPGANRVALILDDQPYLADDRRQSSRRAGRAARAPRSRAGSKRRGGTCTIDDRAAAGGVHDRRGARRAATIVWGTDNIFKSLPRRRAATSTPRSRRGRRSSRASTRPARRSSSTSSRTA